MVCIGMQFIFSRGGGILSRQVLVIGNHRTGSSCIAGILHKSGVCMGEDMLGAHPSNPLGHYEDNEFLRLNDSLVGIWNTPTVLEPEDLGVPRIRYQRMIWEREDKYDIWGIKDPRLCITASYFLDFLSDPVVINTKRSSDSTISSLMKRDGWSYDQAREIFEVYKRNEKITLDLVEDIGIPIFPVYFEDLLDNPKSVISTILENIELLNYAEFTSTLDSFVDQVLVPFVSPDLVNFKDA